MNQIIPLASFDGKTAQPCEAIESAVNAGLLEPCRTFDMQLLEQRGYRLTDEAAQLLSPPIITEEMKARAVYFVQSRWTGKHTGKQYVTWVERDETDDEQPFEQTVKDIVEGQITDVVKILAVDERTGRAWCAMRDVAEAVAAHSVNSGEALLYQAKSFVEYVLGVEAGNELPGEE